MSHFAKLGLSVTLVGTFICYVGCYQESPPAKPQASSSDTEPQPPADPAAASEPSEPAPMPTEGNPVAEPGVEDDAAAADQSQTAKIQAALASLPAEDRALAEKQKICPVGGGPLGAMGTPIKVAVAGQEVFICCEHCEEPLVSDPDKYLAKIGLEPKDDAEGLQTNEETVQ